MDRSTVHAGPQVFGKYTLIAKLARGGMGAIYLARLQGAGGFEKLVVIKRILPHLAENERYIAMLLDEARIAARLSHPNICQVYELDIADDEYYIAMEYLEGVAMQEFLNCLSQRKTLLDARVAVGLMIQACEGLHAAHELLGRDGEPLNLVHRDVSPSNLFITKDGPLKVLDFGIAKTLDKLVQTRTGAVKGKWAYMSPEQVLGKPLDRRSDIFSLGTVLFEGLTNKRLFRRSSEFETCRAITEKDAPGLQAYRQDVPIELSKVVARALSRDREQRFTTAREMGKALAASVMPIGGAASVLEISELLTVLFGDELDERRRFIERVDVHAAATNIDAKPFSLPMAPRSQFQSSSTEESQEESLDTALVGTESMAVMSIPTDVRNSPAPAGLGDGNRHAMADASASQNMATAEPSMLEGIHTPARPVSTNEHAGLQQTPGPRPLSSPPPIPSPVLFPTPKLPDITAPVVRLSQSSWKLWVAVAAALIMGVGGTLAYVSTQLKQPPPTPVVVYEGRIVDELNDASIGSAKSALPADAGVPPAAAGSPQPDKKPVRKRDQQRKANDGDDGDPYNAVLRRYSSQLQSCLRKHGSVVKNKPTIRMDIKIDESGKVTAVSLASRELDQTPLGQCIRKIVLAIPFGKQVSPVSINIPLKVVTER